MYLGTFQTKAGQDWTNSLLSTFQMLIINDFPDHDKRRHYDLQNNYIRDFPNHDKQSWTRLGRLIV